MMKKGAVGRRGWKGRLPLARRLQESSLKKAIECRRHSIPIQINRLQKRQRAVVYLQLVERYIFRGIDRLRIGTTDCVPNGKTWAVLRHHTWGCEATRALPESRRKGVRSDRRAP